MSIQNTFKKINSYPIWKSLVVAIIVRYCCHCIMLIPVLLNELRPAPTLHDVLLANLPYLEFVARWNYVIWIFCYIPLTLYLLKRSKPLFFQFIITDCLISLLRGITIPLTGLGPTMGLDTNVIHPFNFWSTWLSIVNPINAIIGNSAGIYLTKDLFFSGHIASTFLLYLFSRKIGKISSLFFLLHIVCLLTVLFAHLHYAIDIVGAYAITYTVFKIIDGRVSS